MLINNHISRSRLQYRLVALPAAIFFLCIAQVSVADDIFLKIGDIKGESVTEGFEENIAALAWSWGMTQTGSFYKDGGGGAGKANVQGLTFTHYLDSTTTALMRALLTGEHFEKVVLTLTKSGGDYAQSYVVIELGNVLISGIATGGSEGSGRPIEEVSLNFGKMKIAYRSMDVSGKGGATMPLAWDITANVEVDPRRF